MLKLYASSCVASARESFAAPASCEYVLSVSTSFLHDETVQKQKGAG